MRMDAKDLEEGRIGSVPSIEEYPAVHERHRIFPEIFEDREHKNILDISAGIGVVGNNIKKDYNANILCNEISNSCLKVMKKAGLRTISFDLDREENIFPLKDGAFDAVICLATIEHIIHIDRFVEEIYRRLKSDGRLYLSAPNYTGFLYLMPFLITGRTFHNPLKEESRYEFYAHVRYFTYKTMLEFMAQFGLYAEKVYLALPKESSKFMKLKSKSPLKGKLFQSFMHLLYFLLGPRWASEPVICFKKVNAACDANYSVKII